MNIKHRYKIILIIVLGAFVHNSFAQATLQDEFYSSCGFTYNPNCSPFFISLRNLNFFKNNEYFNDFVYSRALAGTIIEPTCNYRVNKDIMLTAGIYIHKYYGDNSLDKLKPLFRVNWQITNGINLIMGDLNQGLNHRMVEPLYQFDRHYTHNDEEGVQIIFNKKHFFSDFWVNYDRNSRPRDKEQELMQLAYSGSYTINLNPNIPLKIFIQGIWSHEGGQDLAVSYPVHTIANAAGGIECTYNWNNAWDIKAGTIMYYANSTELSPIKLEHFPNGYGYFGGLFCQSKYMQAEVGYWHGHHFISMQGEPLYQSKSYKYNSLSAPERRTLILKLGLKKEITKGMVAGIRYESYWGSDIQSYDYFYGIHLLINDEIFFNNTK
jgi:hypothetical protein